LLSEHTQIPKSGRLLVRWPEDACERPVASCAVKPKRIMRSGTYRPPPPMPALRANGQPNTENIGKILNPLKNDSQNSFSYRGSHGFGKGALPGLPERSRCRGAFSVVNIDTL